MRPLPVSLERRLLVSAFALTLAPVIAQGLWRPLQVAFGGMVSGIALQVTVASLFVAGLAIALALRQPRMSGWAGGGVLSLAALGATVLIQGGPATCLVLLVVGSTMALTIPLCLQRLPQALDGLLVRRPLYLGAWALLTAAVVVKAAMLSTFIADPTLTELSLLPRETFLTYHNCFTGFIQALELHDAGEKNLYDLARLPLKALTITGPSSDPHFAPFYRHEMLYPPQFLLVPLALTRGIGGFLEQRAVWYGFNGVVVAWGLWSVAHFAGGRRAAVALLLAPTVWMTCGYALQPGNPHALVSAMAMLGMIAFYEKRRAVGGGLLAGAVLAKILPGLLAFLLVAQRRWREVAWTLAFAILLSGLTLVVMGPSPYEAFFRYLVPRLLSGESHPYALRDARAITGNYSIVMLPFKLELLGLDMGGWKAAHWVGTLYTVFLGVLTFLASRRWRSPGEQAILWLAVLSLATLRNIAAPPYVLCNVFWLISLVAGGLKRQSEAFVLTGLVAAMLLPAYTGAPPVMAALSLITQGVVVGVLVWSIVSPSSVVPTTASSQLLTSKDGVNNGPDHRLSKQEIMP